MLLALIVAVAFAGDPLIQKDKHDEAGVGSASTRAIDVESTTRGEVLTMAFLQRIPTGRHYASTTTSPCLEPICAGFAGEVWRRLPGIWVDPGIRRDGEAARRRRTEDRWRQAPLAVLPTGHTVDGLLRLFPGVGPQSTPTVMLDGAILDR